MSEIDVTDDGASTEAAQSETSDASAEASPLAEVEKWKKHSRTWEDRSKQNLAELKAAQEKLASIDTDKAHAEISQARKEAEDARRENAMLRAAFTYKLSADDLELLSYVPLEGLDDAAKKLAARTQRTFPELGQGVGQAANTKVDMNSMMRQAAGLE